MANQHEITVSGKAGVVASTLSVDDLTINVGGVVDQGVKDNRCLKHLYVTDPRADKLRIQETRGGLLRDSYCWILENDLFQRFRDDPQSRLLWIKGDPGKGKTMLLCGIVDELERKSAKRLSYFFCQATVAQLSSATGVLRGLIYLLIIQQPSLISYVRAKYDILEEKLFEGINVWVSLTGIFMDMLNDPSLQDAVLIVDALDECTKQHSELLRFIVKSSSRIKWIVSSRNHCPDIGQRLRNTTQTAKLCLEDIGSTISEAVDVYIRHKVDQLTREKNYNDELCRDVQNHLMSNANGTFLWVALVCKELANPGVLNRDMVKRLKSFPAGLKELYKRMMEDITNSYNADLCKQILAVMSVVYNPVTLKELSSLVEALEEFNQNDLEETIGACGSFLTLREGVIYFVHQSAREYLLDKACNQIVPSGTAHQHNTIFSRSLLVMARSLRRDIYDLHHPGISIDDVRQPEPDPLAPTRYSCFYWVDHLSDAISDRPSIAVKDLQDDGTVHQFLSKKYLYWLEALSLLRAMPEGVTAMTRLETLLKGFEGTRLFDLVRDARRFILAHGWAIGNAPLQAYASALTFSPRRSITRRLFSGEEPRWILAKPTIAEDWDACLETLEGHSGGVTWVVFSPDGQCLASASRDRTVKIWDAMTGQCLATLEGHGGGVNSVAFSADGQRLASALRDRTVKVWNATTGQCTATLRGHDDGVNSVMFSPDGQRLASASRDRTVTMWDAKTGHCQAMLRGHGDGVRSVVFSPDGQRLASASRDRTVKIWDAKTGHCQATLRGHGDGVNSVAFSPNSQRLASASYDRTVKIWDAMTEQCVDMLEGHGGKVSLMVFSLDDQRLASASRDRTIKIWDVTTGHCTATLRGHSDSINSVIFSPDGQRLASASRDMTVKIWDATTGHCQATLRGHGDGIYSVTFSPDSQRLASASCGRRDKTVKIWDITTGHCTATLRGHSDSINSVTFSPNSQRLASASNDTTIKIWNAMTGDCQATLRGHDDGVNSVMFSPDGQRLASASYDGTVKIWDVTTGNCQATLESHGGGVLLVAFSPDGQRLASASIDGIAKIWDATTVQCLATLVIGSVIDTIRFDKTGTNLLTDDRTFDLNLVLPPPSSATALPSSILQHYSCQCQGYGISANHKWITYRGRNVLWIPFEYRPVKSAVAASIALGCRSGMVLLLQFSGEGPIEKLK